MPPVQQAKSLTSSKQELEQVLKNAAELHSLPVVVLEAHQMLNDSRSGAQDVAELLGRDAAISSRILKMANSSYYGFEKKIGNLAQGIVVLGFQALKNLTLTIGVLESFRADNAERHHFPAFWARSLACAIATDVIAKKVQEQENQVAVDFESAYMAGLLHDLGQLVIAQHLPTSQQKIQVDLSAGQARCAAEEKQLGQNHCSIGAELLKQWKLPENIVEAAGNHHDCSEKAGPLQLSEMVQLADQLVTSFGVGETDEALSGVSPGLSARLGYDDVILSSWIQEICTKLESASDFFELIGYGKIDFSK